MGVDVARPGSGAAERPIKVLFVNNFRGRGGGEEFLRDLQPGLLRRGVQVGLVCRPNTRYPSSSAPATSSDAWIRE
jgi:hypothetical protein